MEVKKEGKNLAHYYVNELVEESEILWQIGEIADKGFNGIILSPARGLQVGFMSPEWISIVSLILEIAKKKNLFVYFSTEAIYPANILEAKYYYNIEDYKARYLVLEDEIQITEKIFINELLSKYESLKLENLYLFAIQKDKSGAYDSENYLYVDKYSMSYCPPSNENWVLCVFGIKEVNVSSQGLYPFNFFVKNTTFEFVDKVYSKNTELFSKFSEVFKGFYEPRLFPDIKCDKGLFWYEPLIKKFNTKIGVTLENIIPQLFFSEAEAYEKIRREYYAFLLSSYKKNFIAVIDSFVAKNELEVIYYYDNNSKNRPISDISRCSMLFDVESYNLSKKSSIAFSLSFNTANKLTLVDSLCFQTLNSLGIIKNPTPVISDFHNRFNFSPHRLSTLKKYALLFNFKNSITSAFLYSIKGFRKNDITPNIFCQTLFWKYVKNTNCNIKSIIEKLNANNIMLEKNDYDIAVIFADDSAFKPITAKPAESPYLAELLENMFLNNRDIMFFPSSKIDTFNLDKHGDGYVISWKSKNIFVKHIIALCDSLNNQKINTFASKFLGDNAPFIINSATVNAPHSSEKINIRDFGKINRLFTSDENEELQLSYEDGIIAKRYGSDKNIHFQLLNTKDESKKVTFKIKKGKKTLPCVVVLPPFAFETISLTTIKDIADKKSDSPFEVSDAPKYRIIFAKNWHFNAAKANILPLTTWVFKVGGPKDDEVGTVHFYETSFFASSLPTKLSLILDGVWGEKDISNQNKPVKIFVNSLELTNNFYRPSFGHTLYKVDITNLVVKGENKIVIKSKGIHFSPINLNEPQFIEGDFVLKKKVNDVWHIDKPEKSFTSGNWVEEGYPFFFGYGLFEQYFELSKGYKSIFIIIKKFDYPIEISLNDKDFIEMVAPPYKLDITQMVNEGKNKLSIKVPSSAVNIFTGTKMAEGLTGEVSLEVY